MLYYLRNLKSYLMKIPFKTLISLAMTAVMVIACGNTASSNNASDVESASSDIKVNGVKVKLEDGIYALFSTSMGDVLVALSSLEAPMTVGNFVALAEGNHPLVDANKPYFNGMVFHRVIPNFMIQGGGMLPDMSEKPAGEPIVNESKNRLHNVRGSLAMARTNDPDSATAQFFVNQRTNLRLDWAPGKAGYTVFGEVTDGMDVVDYISSAPVRNVGGHSDVPVDTIMIKEIVRKSLLD